MSAEYFVHDSTQHDKLNNANIHDEDNEENQIELDGNNISITNIPISIGDEENEKLAG